MLKGANFIFLLSICAQFTFAHAQSKFTPEQYIEQYKNDAIVEMEKFNIPASITLAQAMLESGNGNSDLALHANNHFGIKCHNNWNGNTFIKDDDKKDECFRKYESVLESYNDHSSLLTSYSRYSFLFKLDRTNYKGWAKGLKQAGYATSPQYADVLIGLIEKYQLYKLDGDANKMSTSAKPSLVIPDDKQNNKHHEILRLGIKKYIIVQPDDTYEKIAKETDKDLWQLYKYNDATSKDKLITGQKLFLQPKRNKAKEPFHKVKAGETMKSISQFYGIKLRKLYLKNNMKEGDVPKVGDTLYLRKNKPTDSF
jgi:LysM repeat protein